MAFNMHGDANTNANSDHDPDFKTFWKQLHEKELPPKTVFAPQYPHAEQIYCYSVTPKRMEYWDLAIEAGFTFADLESMKRRHKNVALSPRVLLSDWLGERHRRMRIRSLNLEFGDDDQFGEEDKQAIRFVLRLAAKYPPKSVFDEGIHLRQCFVEMKQLHDIPLVTHHVHLGSCDLVDCDKLMFNISQNSKWVKFDSCELANGGADLCRWLSPNNCSVTEVSFFGTRITCDSLAKLFQSNKRINKLKINLGLVHGAQHIHSQETEQIIKLLSDASHLKKLGVADVWNRVSRQGQMTRFDALISLLGNKSLSYLRYGGFWNPGMFEVPPETLSAQMEALQQALEETTNLTYLHNGLSLPNEHARVYKTLVKRILRRNYHNEMRAALCSLPTWPRPLALFGQMLTRTSKRRGTMHAMGPMDPMNETFHLLLQGSEMLKRT